ncbi:unnamed protein product [Pedinophyceae sp. YPF-701]|nr:unnamed protein product [Pedinophyceae sp. YPF-701]
MPPPGHLSSHRQPPAPPRARSRGATLAPVLSAACRARSAQAEPEAPRPAATLAWCQGSPRQRTSPSSTRSIVFTQEFPTVFGRPSARADGTKPSASDLSGTVREFRIGDVADDMTPTRGPVLLARTHDDMLRGDRAKQLLEACLTDRETFMAKVFSVNKGGVLASVAGLTLFVPNSHLIRDADTEVRKQFRKGTEIELTLMRVDEPEDFRHGQAKILASMTLARQAHAYKRICVGALVSGKVRRIEPFGAYVGIDGTSISGLLHVSNLSGRYVEAISDVLSVGEPVKAIVMGMEEGYRQISLSTAELEDYPGQIQEEKATVMAAAERRAEEFRERFDQWMEEEGTEREDGSWMYESSEDDVGA